MRESKNDFSILKNISSTTSNRSRYPVKHTPMINKSYAAHEPKRKKILTSIENENIRLAKLFSRAKSTFDRKKFERDYRHHRKLVELHQEHPTVIKSIDMAKGGLPKPQLKNKQES